MWQIWIMMAMIVGNFYRIDVEGRAGDNCGGSRGQIMATYNIPTRPNIQLHV